MTKERAKEIWNTRGPFGNFKYTEKEDAQVREVWKHMPGWTCWADALLRIAKDRDVFIKAIDR